MIFLILIALLRVIKFNRYQSKYEDNEITETFLVVDYQLNKNKLTIKAKGKETIIGYYYLNDDYEYLKNNLKIGSSINLKGIIKNPSTNQLPNTFNYQDYLKSINIHKQLEISEIKVLNYQLSIGNKLKNFFYRSNDTLSSAYIQALIFANKDQISETANQSYQINGISHLLAISGMHISLLCLIIENIIRKINISHTKIIVIIFLIFYSFITNFNPSIIRAVIFYTLMAVNKRQRHQFTANQVLKVALLLSIIIYPFFVHNLSFQYSAVTSYFITRIKIDDQNYLLNTLKISLLAFLASLPITINNFYEINILSPFLNLIFVPMVTFVVYPLTLISFILPLLYPLSNVVLTIFEGLSTFFATNMAVKIAIPEISLIFIIIYYIILNSIKKINISNIILVLTVIIIVKISPYFDNNGYVYFLNVGQGDSSLIISPKRQDIILIDTGGILSYQNKEDLTASSSLANNISTFLKSIGITTIDTLIISHGDIDHLGSAISLSENIKINNLRINQGSINNYEALLQKSIKNSNFFPKGLLYQELTQSICNDENDNSIISVIQIYATRLLYTGDISKKVEEEIITKYQIPEINILKVAHHGSNTSTSRMFIETINPQFAIISSGLNNRYNHPSEETIDVLNQLQVKYYNTAYDHNILIKIDKKGFTIIKDFA